MCVSECLCARVRVKEEDSGSLAGCLTMADGSGDEDVIHLASFNTHRSQGRSWCGACVLISVFVS